MKKSTVADQQFTMLLVLIATQVLCAGCDPSREEENEYVTKQVADNKNDLAKELLGNINLEKHSERLELKPLELTDIISKGGDERRARTRKRPRDSGSDDDEDDDEERRYVTRQATRNKAGLAREMLSNTDLEKNVERLGLEPLRMADLTGDDGRPRGRKTRAKKSRGQQQPVHSDRQTDYDD